MDTSITRRLPVGAEVQPAGGVHFRVWAPRRKRVEVVFEKPSGGAQRGPRSVALAPETDGFFAGFASTARDGTRYRFRLDSEERLYPDPASRFQPEGPHGPSQVVDPACFDWTDGSWRGRGLDGQVIYEMHIGTFTGEGTWEAASQELPELAALGITTIEVMPVAEFAGRFGWGYDGVDPYAPTHLYGQPDDFRRFVNSAHAVGLGVILDVVYNHLGPDGNYLPAFAPAYFTDRYAGDWGDPINFDGDNAGPVREYFVSNAGYWIGEYHLDGLRLDATQSIHDQSREHVVADIGRSVRMASSGRATFVVAENEPNEARLVRSSESGGYGLDALWNDDFHHSATVALTGHTEAYYSDFRGTPQELISAVKWGSLFQGQHFSWHRRRRGTPAFDVPSAAFVVYLQNHDQVANSLRGLRAHLLTSPGRYRAMTALMLLAPGTPMLFQGQEFASSSPFVFFADHNPELAKAVRRGRFEFLGQFPSVRTAEAQAMLPDPSDPATFARCKLDFDERRSHADVYALHRDLLRLRRDDPAFRTQRGDRMFGAVLGPEVLVLRFFGGEEGVGALHPGDGDRLVLVNLGRDLRLESVAEPLLAPVDDCGWATLWSSEHPMYGGGGMAPLEREDGWRIPGHAAVVLAPTPLPDEALPDVASRA